MKTALIIGGSGGIGFETVKTLSEQGIKLFVSYNKNKEILEKKILEKKIKNISLYNINVKDKESVQKNISYILKDNKIDIIIYTVSIPIINKKIQDLVWQDFQNHLDIQIKGLFEIIKALKEPIQKNEKMKFIVVLTEYCFGKPPALISHYITAKYGLMGFVKSMVSELSKNNCTFNMISPGMVNTNLLSNLPPKLIEITAETNPLKRIAEPKDISKIISFLASENSDYLNGVNILVNGGNVII